MNCEIKNINLLFDGRLFKSGLVGCVSRPDICGVAKNLVQALGKIPLVSLYVYLPTKDKNLTQRLRESLEGLKFEILSDNDDLSKINAFFSPAESKPQILEQYPKISCYIVLHDVIPLSFPSHFCEVTGGWFSKLIDSLNNDDYYFSGSDSTIKDFLRYFPQINPNNIQVIPLPIDSKYSPISWEKAVNIIVNKMIEVERKKSSQPCVTIITATYNLIEQKRKNWFIQNLQSVKSQTYPNIEHIIIDGASIDGTIEILEEYQNKGWIKYYSEPDAGIYDAMNKGISKANGKYVVCLNSDDFYCEEKAVEWLVAKAEETNADAVCASANALKDEKFVAFWPATDTNGLIFGTMACHQTFLIKASVMKELGLYDLKYKTSSDTGFMYKMLNANKKFAIVDPVIVGYRIGGFSKDTAAIDKDVKASLYEAYGKYHGLSCYDCSQLVRYRFLNLPIGEAIELGTKLISTGNSFWIKQYFSRLLANSRKRIYRLFGIFPILKVKRNNDKAELRLFCFIPFLKIEKRNKNDTRVYLFNFIPILRFRKTNKHEYINLFDFIPLIRGNR
jgi:glycosyltransferase involved in cell wall biosynthesis